jgi:hypothetical protein
VRKPDCVRALVARGWLRITHSRFDDAAQDLDAAVRFAPNHFRAHMGLLTVAGLTGDYERAMVEFEWTETAAGKLRPYEQPLWDGSPLEGRTILLWEDAGLGDTLQRMRFIPLVAARGARIVMECPATLVPIAEQLPDVQRIVATGTPLPAFDVHSPLCLLASRLGIRVSNLPARVPYITIPPDLTKKWRARLGACTERPVTIGLVWASMATSHGKSAPLAAFGPLARSARVRFISLQVGPQAIELLAPPEGLSIEPFVDDSFTVADTGATIQSLDLVISVDTMAAHLAGALGRPVWLLLTWRRPDWRWLNQEGRSPWYPSMRLFQQRPEEDWSAFLAQVGVELEAALARNDFSAPLPSASGVVQGVREGATS